MFDIPTQKALKGAFSDYIASTKKPCAVGFIKFLKLPNPSPAFRSELTMFYGKMQRENVQ